MSKITEITSTEFFNGVLKSGGTAIIDLWAKWCKPCDLIPPILEKLSDKHKDIKFFKIDLGDYENADIMTRYNVLSIPTLLFVRGGELFDKVVGVKDKEYLEAKIDKLLEDDKEHIGV